MTIQITVPEFELFRHFIHQYAGIDLAPAKKIMVSSRLYKRVQHYNFSSYGEYFHFATAKHNKHECEILVNILTTNETYFFREPKHFDFFRDKILKEWKTGHFKVWSAASSTGEEAYSLSMLLSENAGSKTWEILATDINSTVLKKASNGIYFMERLELLDPILMKKYCLKGVGEQAGSFRIIGKLRQKINFHRLNLTKRIPDKVNSFDVIFLRNVLIYFNNETKQQVVNQLIERLKPGGYFFISHSETLSRVTDKLKMIQPSIYIKI